MMGKPGSKVARRYTVSGRVQGVGFRYFAERWASQLGVRGYVKNRWDGTVEVYAIGDNAALEEFKRRLAEGPRGAFVSQVDERDEDLDNRHTRFVIEHEW